MPRDVQRGEASIATIAQTLSEDVLLLFREHLRLFRLELKHDASVMGRYVATLAVFGVVSLVGFGLLSVSAILFAGWAFGLAGMAFTALTLSLVHLGFGFFAFVKVARGLRSGELGPGLTGQELVRSKKWFMQLLEFPRSSPPTNTP